MKNFCRTLALACITLSLTSLIATAGPIQNYNTSVYNYKDRDPDSGSPLGFLTPQNPSISGTFNLLDSGYDPQTMKITAARITFAFADDNGDTEKEYVSVYLEGSLWSVTNNVEINGNHIDQPNNFDYFYQTWSASNSADQAFLASLQDGIVTYKVKATTGDVYLKIAQLEVTAVSTKKVPDSGATAGMLGSALVGLEVFRRRSRRLARAA